MEYKMDDYVIWDIIYKLGSKVQVNNCKPR